MLKIPKMVPKMPLNSVLIKRIMVNKYATKQS